MARNNFKFSLLFETLFLVILLQNGCLGKDKEPDPEEKNEKSSKIGKNIEDYNEADLRKLLDQWEENDEDIDEEDRYDDDDPRRPPPTPTPGILGPVQIKVDPFTQLKQSKKGKDVMVFVNVAGTPSRKDTDLITLRWQLSLYNAQFQVERQITSDARALFTVKDGSLAWDVKDFLITQPECEMVEIGHERFPGAGAEEDLEKTEL